MEDKHKPLVVIVGPTASGKTKLAIDLATKVNAEIICADSRTVYKHMNIGTAKPSNSERQNVKHWGLDLIEPNERFSAADFKKYADAKIKEVRNRDKVPILVGGTGLYIDGVIFDYQFGPKPDQQLRQRLTSMSAQQLQDYCVANSIELPVNLSNKRHLIRAVEQGGINKNKRLEPISNTIIVGISVNNESLLLNIQHRAKMMFDQGILEEAKRLADTYGWDNESMKANIYMFAKKYTQKELTLDEAIDGCILADKSLAKRQMTWFRRNPFIVWKTREKALDYILEQLAKYK